MADSTSKSKGKATEVPDGHRRVKWLFCPADPDKVGEVVDMPAADAVIFKRENRVAYVEDGTPLGKTEVKGEPFRAPLAGATADTSSAHDTGSTTAATTGR